MSRIAIIPARGGSKRIPKKNIRPFLGIPVIAYPIKTALKSSLFDEIIVSTDSEEIASIARQYGASVPFMRSSKNADDMATTTDVLMEVITKLQEKNQYYDEACCLYPVTPLLQIRYLTEAYNKMNQYHYDAAFPVLPYTSPIERALVMKNGKIYYLHPEYKNTRSQDLETTYYDAGQFYWFRPSVLMSKKQLITDNTTAVVLPAIFAQDIDNEDDWLQAEFKYEWLQKKGWILPLLP